MSTNAIEQMDGSLESAVAAMPDINALAPFEQVRDGAPPIDRGPERQPGQPRNPDNGQWEALQRQQQANQQQRGNSHPGPKQQAEIEAQPEPEAEAVDDETFVEIPSEEPGKPGQRLALKDVFDGYQRAEVLKREIEEVRRGAPAPIEYDRAIYETTQVRGNLLRQAQVYHRMLQPTQPNPALLDENNPNYNPGAYHRQMQIAQEMAAQRQAIEAEIESMSREQAKDLEALQAAKFARERGKVLDLWPDLQKPDVARGVRDDLARYYGIDQDTLNNTVDARFYALAKDALAYRQAQKAQSTAIKLVKAKPKIVRGNARDTSNPREAQRSSAMQRLSQTGSMEDAADAIGALLG